jgi:hypothetical protein
MMGVLGPRYNLVINTDPSSHQERFKVKHFVEGDTFEKEEETVKELQIHGTAALDSINKGTYAVACYISASRDHADAVSTSTVKNITFFISLCHSVSDGPRAIMVATSLISLLRETLVGQEKDGSHQSAFDLQAIILGEDYGVSAQTKPNEEYCLGLNEFVAAIVSNDDPKVVNGVPLLLPEAKQGIPSEQNPATKSGYIDTIHATLSKEETSALRDNCRAKGATVQGALTVACLLARTPLLEKELPLRAAVQVPANCRSLAHNEGSKQGLADNACLCGSAALWHFRKGYC